VEQAARRRHRQKRAHFAAAARLAEDRHIAGIAAAVIEGEITFTVRGQQPRVLKTGEFVYIPRGTIHRNENKSNAPTRTIELLIMDKDKPQNTPAPAE
jgi:quercetin dioxygenase-like cupin family protein